MRQKMTEEEFYFELACRSEQVDGDYHIDLQSLREFVNNKWLTDSQRERVAKFVREGDEILKNILPLDLEPMELANGWEWKGGAN